ncbi:MAG TPA: TadE/TadG family type IV pilus assembly protein [Bauldia sp.]|nr:TadE/TadG family type IV pilus assembly protein [Bauldia sp.]
MALRMQIGRFSIRLAMRSSPCRFRRDQSGATAVEFGLLALPFFALLMAIIQVAMVFFATQAMETGVLNASRLIRTGQAQQQSMSAATFKQKICDAAGILFVNCTSNLVLDVRTYSTFGSVDLAPPVDSNGNLITTWTFSPGSGSSIVVVRAFYEWPVWSKLLSFNLSNLNDGNHLIAAVTAFRNEPFPW